MTRKALSGTKEWASDSANCITGCSHDCAYCYASAIARRYGWLRQTTVNGKGEIIMGERPWSEMRVRQLELARTWTRKRGVIMFPTSHDITPATLEPCTQVLLNILRAGNRVLITTKPHLAVVENLCRVLEPWRAQIMWRMTITAGADALLSYWEPGAPRFGERLGCLGHAWNRGWRTSVSIEPMLDPCNVVHLVDQVSHYVTDTIWIGMMNHPRHRVRVRTDFDRLILDDLIYDQREENIRAIYAELKDCPFIRWKESIKEVVGLPPATEPERWSSIAKEERP